ncbi:hypothetical protein HZ326_16918 [Fusarium oxysporum f. sp. albedinis]|nr:hypothetical protein HZ326_16918 [Fusarium oxysporum f. sp. albedinis]
MIQPANTTTPIKFRKYPQRPSKETICNVKREYENADSTIYSACIGVGVGVVLPDEVCLLSRQVSRDLYLVDANLE